MDLSTLVGSLLTGMLGGYLTFRLKESQEASKTAARKQRNLAALGAEIEYCARLAGTYEESEFKAPLYRFPRYVFDVVYPALVAETFSDVDVTGLTGFYSQVDQMNRGLDAVENYRAAGQDALLRDEVSRLMRKAAEMRHPTDSLGTPKRSGYYEAALAAVKRHLKKP